MGKDYHEEAKCKGKLEVVDDRLNVTGYMVKADKRI